MCVWKLFLAFVLLVGSVTASAEYLEPPPYGVCRDSFSRPVRYIPFPHHVFTVLFPNSSIATTKGGSYPIVGLDADKLSTFSAEFQRMVHWHECAHHTLGHLSGSSYGNTSNRKSKDEDAADCWAARMMSSKELKIAANDLRASGLPGGITHRAAKSRADYILSCTR